MSRTSDAWPSRRLPLVIASNGMLRVASGASSVLVGVYVADLASRGFSIGAGLVGTLAAISFGAELLGAMPLGVLSDAVSVRKLMTSGALLAALATLLFGITHDVGVFATSRALEGLAAAAVVPALLAYLSDATAGDHVLRARAMSYFELSLLAGLALGGIVGGQLWSRLGSRAFSALAVLYAVAALLLFIGSVDEHHGRRDVWRGLRRSLGTPALRRLAPVWLCMNAIVGVWLGPTLYFLLTHRSDGSQVLAGLFADDAAGLGWLLFVYALLFASGVLAWSRVLPRIDLQRALRISLVAMLGVSVGLLMLNHMGDEPIRLRWMLTLVIALLIMVESGFTPAALSLLASAIGPGVGRGSAMGIYSFLLSLGALAGSVLAAVTGRWAAIDGLTYATLGLALVALALLPRLGSARLLAVEGR
ncbi:MAG TPA: MFS transporter [Vicinamibacterales bacterium]|nr:MFS transporter [Vicinamibacterales bacterium]